MTRRHKFSLNEDIENESIFLIFSFRIIWISNRLCLGSAISVLGKRPGHASHRFRTWRWCHVS